MLFIQLAHNLSDNYCFLLSMHVKSVLCKNGHIGKEIAHPLQTRSYDRYTQVRTYAHATHAHTFYNQYLITLWGIGYSINSAKPKLYSYQWNRKKENAYIGVIITTIVVDLYRTKSFQVRNTVFLYALMYKWIFMTDQKKNK